MRLRINRECLTKILVVFCFVFSGCASIADPDQEMSESGDSIHSSLQIYGNFCGPGYPKIDSKSSSDKLRHLEAIVPKDELDLYCKKHDVCYEKTFYFNSECDQKLIGRTRNLAEMYKAAERFAKGKSKILPRKCSQMANMVADYFEFFHPSRQERFSQKDVVKWVSKSASMPISVLLVPTHGLSLVNSGGIPETCPKSILVINKDGTSAGFKINQEKFN